MALSNWPNRNATITLKDGGFLFFPILYNIIPGEIVSKSIYGSKFWLLGGQQKSSVFESDNISWLGIPPLDKF